MSKYEAKINQEMFFQPPRIGGSLSNQPNIPDLNEEPCSDSEGNKEGHSASYVVPHLSYELEVEIFARVPCLEYWKLQFLNKQFMQLLKSGEIYRVRQQRGLVKPYVCLHSGRGLPWSIFDIDFENFQKVPDIPSDDLFALGDKETLSVSTQLLVFGKDEDAVVVWRYEFEMHKWFKGPSMITPRALFGSASRGNDAFVAGGIKENSKVLSSAEKYNGDTKMWTMIQDMHRRRKYSSGCFLQGKFYVIGGQDKNNNHLTSGERYDEKTNSWELIPDMLSDMTFKFSQSPPLIAVVDDKLYLLEPSVNELLVYNIETNSWKQLGIVPVRANELEGWGVAFKSVGDRLLVIGPSALRSSHRTIAVHTCRPSLEAEQQTWEAINYCSDFVERHDYIHNCCVMFA